MAEKLTPSSDQFVVRVKTSARPAAARRLASVGTVEELQGGDALLIRAGKTGKGRSAWDAVKRAAGAGATVQPVLLDADGQPHFPTGEISVRFEKAPSDDQLQQFAAAHGLRLRDRNELAPQQAVFLPAEATDGYLPDLVNELANEDGTKAAWANTQSRYRRD